MILNENDKNDRFSEVKHICGESTISVYAMALTAILNLFQTYAIVSYLNFYHIAKKQISRRLDWDKKLYELIILTFFTNDKASFQRRRKYYPYLLLSDEVGIKVRLQLQTILRWTIHRFQFN